MVDAALLNVNDVVPRYLASGAYQPRPSVATISNAMDVGAPSNFPWMEALCGGSWEVMRGRISGAAYDDRATRAAIREVKVRTGYVLDPHGAVGWLAAKDWRDGHAADHTVVLETAHPAKFLDVIEEELGAGAVEVPERLACLAGLAKVALPMPADEAAFKAWLAGWGG